MTVNSAVMALAGAMVLISLALAQLFSPWFLLLTTFVGTQSLPIGFHGLLSGGDDFQETRIEVTLVKIIKGFS